MRYAIYIFFLLFCGNIFSQDSARVRVKRHPSYRHFTFYGGLGYNYYFNSMQIGAEGINPSNYAFLLKAMWEPEHRLSIGVETGYIRMYQWQYPFRKNEYLALFQIPLNTCFSMRLHKGLFASFSFGSSILHSYLNRNGNEVSTFQLTLANINLGLGYKVKMGHRWSFVVETNYLYLSKANDMSMLFLTRLGYSIW